MLIRYWKLLVMLKLPETTTAPDLESLSKFTLINPLRYVGGTYLTTS
nr:unnamed protein product [Callosobruchus analis]